MKYIGILIVLLFLSFGTKANIKDTLPTNKISTFANVWGLLKYYHPNIKKREISFEDWNIVLIKNIDIILENKTEFNEQINNLIKHCGELKRKKGNIKNAYLSNNIFQWINKNQLLSVQNKAKLKDVILSSYNIKHHQISKEILNDYKAKLISENYLDTLSYNRIAMLGLISYLQDVKYFYAYKADMSKSINSLLKEFIPATSTIYNYSEYKRFILRIAANINDSHSMTYSPIRGRRLRINTRFINDTIVVRNNKTNLSQIKKGDFIIKINDIPILTYIDSLKQYISASSKQARNKKISLVLLYSNKEKDLKLELINSKGEQYTVIANSYRNNKPYYNYSIKQKKQILSPYQNDSAFYLLENNIGYINIGFLRDEDIRKAFHSLKDTKAIIIDTRAYSAINVNRFLKYFSNKYGKFMNVELYSKKNIGFFEKNFLVSHFIEKIRPFHFSKRNRFYEKYYKNKKIVILINEFNISFSEQLLLAIKYCRPDAFFIGRTTDGSFGNNSEIRLPKNLIMSFTTAKVKSYDNKKLHSIGIKPDLVVKKSVESIFKDKILNVAYSYLKNKIED